MGGSLDICWWREGRLLGYICSRRKKAVAQIYMFERKKDVCKHISECMIRKRGLVFEYMCRMRAFIFLHTELGVDGKIYIHNIKEFGELLHICIYKKECA